MMSTLCTQQTDFHGEISLDLHRVCNFTWMNLWGDEISQISPPKKNSSAAPGQIELFSAVFLLFIEVFVGWDALAKAKEG